VAEPLFYVGPDEIPDKYRLKRQIGSGGEAQLWEAELNVSGTWEPVAVKILRADHFDDFDRWKDRWAEQAEVLRFIRHPGVVGVREHFEAGGMHYAAEATPGQRALYLVMNWHDGQTLREWSVQHRSAADSYEALRFLAQVGDVLDWLHSGQATPSGRPVIHADVTANNVLVTPAGQAVLVDFGLVRLAAGLSPAAEGTFGYVAPEVKALGAYSPASDRYAFGALTYLVLTGTPAPATIAEIRTGLAQVPAVVAQPTLLDHLLRMFDPDPQSRPSCGDWIRYFRVTGATSADVVGAGFTAPLDPASIHTTSLPPPTSPAPKPKRRHRAAILAGVIVAVLLGGVIGVAALGGGDGDGDSDDTATEVTDPPAGAATNTTDTAGAAATTADTAAAATDTTAATTSTEPTTTTTTSTTTTTTEPTTTTVPRTTTTAALIPRPVPLEAYTFGSFCTYNTQNVQNTSIDVAACGMGYYDGEQEASLDINVSPRATRLTARIVFADRTLPVETVGLVKLLIDGALVEEGSVSFASPFVIDIDVANKRRVTLRLTVHEDSQPNLSNITFALVEPFFVS
jgi:serine/threonine protein kinase